MHYTTHPLPRREDFNTEEEFIKAMDAYYYEDTLNESQEMKTEEIIEMMKQRPVTRAELCAYLSTSDRNVRTWIASVKRNYPVISTSNLKGYKIATSEEDLELVADAIRNNRNKALSIFTGCSQLKKFQAQYGKDSDQLIIEF